MAPPENVKCPECNGPMVSRKGQFGVFWGCASFPKCKGTRDNQGRSKADRMKWREEQEEKEAAEGDEMTSKERTNRKWDVK